MGEGNLKWYSLITNCIMDFINFMPHVTIMIFRLGLHWWRYFRIFRIYGIWVGNIYLINKYSPPDLEQCFYFGFTHDISCNRWNETSTKMFRILEESGKISPIVQLSLEETVSLMLFLLIMNEYSKITRHSRFVHECLSTKRPRGLFKKLWGVRTTLSSAIWRQG